MFSRKKLAAVSWLVGGIAMTCAGASQAHADGPRECTRDAQGNVTCVQKSETSYTSKDGTYHVQQSLDCTSESGERGRQPVTAVGNPGTTRTGSEVNCSSTAPVPKDVSLPGFPR
ncbi:hypothetical protein [Streptomyces sp. NBC_00344]|uniref:hypothetical protein n=1 Tax=Streptomyces sp. NBC_00344 TaxID=2975720 RepID=UPI002E1D90B0